ncbi:hypothetical protein ARMGADRAFT_440434 [Armillaria gallica]|uniref:Uncharacterized protein n=1 Tax=Armillaria gallica TaxID=47427 RepID=A0A2H3CYH1_ARMGA|nr:hypothetical protein ARMGADRAFT_440434 [Armillaria gallica]
MVGSKLLVALRSVEVKRSLLVFQIVAIITVPLGHFIQSAHRMPQADPLMSFNFRLVARK